MGPSAVKAPSPNHWTAGEFPPVSSLLKPFFTEHSLESFCQSESHSSLDTELSMSPIAYGTQEGLLGWRWNMKQKLSSEYKCKDQTSSYPSVCPSTSKVPYPSDTESGLGITNFG